MNKKDQHIDEMLLTRIQSGDQKALAQLVKRWHKLFCDKAYWLVKDKEAAKDIAQDSWTIIIKKIDTLKTPKQFKYWAYRIVCNKAMDWLRLQAKQRQSEINGVAERNDDNVTSEKEHLERLLLKAIKELPEEQKQILNLFYTQSYSLKQISSMLHISMGTAKSRLFYAREKLKETLKHRNYEN